MKTISIITENAQNIIINANQITHFTESKFSDKKLFIHLSCGTTIPSKEAIDVLIGKIGQAVKL